MPPHSSNPPKEQHEKGDSKFISGTHLKLPSEIGTDYEFKRKIVWWNVIGFALLHLGGVYGVIRAFTHANIYTTLWMLAVTFATSFGVTLGAHRLFSHKAFKAKAVLRLVLVILHTIAGQNCLYIWVRDHRQHHKYSDTDADPHNSNRGFFFSHVGWLMSRKHPAVLSKGKTIDLSDLEADWIVMWQKTYYKPLYLIFAFAIPLAVPISLWNETYINSLLLTFFTRYILMLNITWLVNSAAHFYGTKPYDKNIKPVESWIVSYVTNGEGWHNYHHAFPWDYRAAEYGTRYSMTTFVINLLATLGLAYDLRTTPHKLVESRFLRTGDGSRTIDDYNPQKNEFINAECISSNSNDNIIKRNIAVQG